MNRMILANLVHRPMRSLISIVAIAVEVILILLIVGLSLGILNDSKERRRNLGDAMVSPPGSSFISGISGAPVSARIADVIAALPHVHAVTPVITQLNASGAIEIIYGIEPSTFQAVAGPFQYLDGGPFNGPDSILVDDYFAAGNHVHAGSKIELFNHEFTVSGVVENGKGARRFVPLATLQELMGATGKASIFYVRADDPANADAVVKEIKNVPGLQKFSTLSMKEWLTLMTPGNLPGFSTFINVVIGVAVTIGFIVIFQAMYAAVMERTREIGILKSLGAGKGYIVNVILRETLLLAVFGILLGIALSYVARGVIVNRVPTLRILLTGGWIWRATLIAIVGAIAGAIYPAFKAARKDPIDALAYE